jgi:hypothetical protein
MALMEFGPRTLNNHVLQCEITYNQARDTLWAFEAYAGLTPTGTLITINHDDIDWRMLSVQASLLRLRCVAEEEYYQARMLLRWRDIAREEEDRKEMEEEEKEREINDYISRLRDAVSMRSN